MAMIMNPPMINGHPVMWKTPAGEIHPFTAIGVPPKKLLRHVRGALREIGTVSHLKQDFINGERVFDWSGILYLPPGQAFPSELRFDFDPNAYALLPAAVALPCPSCYRRDPKTCHCPAPACHYSLVEQRTREQAEAAAAATAPTPLADAPPAAPAPSPTPSPTPAPAPTQAPAEPPATPAAGPTPPRAQALEPGAGTPMPTGAGRAKRRQLARLEGQPEKPADKAAPAHDAPISRQLNTVQAPPPRPVTPTEDSAMDTDPAATRSEKSAKTRLPTRHIAKKKLPALSDRRGPAAAELEATNSASDEDHSMDLADTTSDGDYATDENDSSSDGSSASSEAEPTSDEEHDMDADDPRLQPPRAAAAVPQARPTLPIPGINLISQNLQGTGLGARAYDAHHDEWRQFTDTERQYRESKSRTKKLSYLLANLRGSSVRDSHRAIDVAFLQEFNSAANPTTLLLSRFGEYQTFAMPPGHGNDTQRTMATATDNHQRRNTAAMYDTVVLVHRRLGDAELQRETSCPRATFVTVPTRGLLLVSIHGPFMQRAGIVDMFHDGIIDAVQRYITAGWTPIIAGDFNVPPFPGDRESTSSRAYERDNFLIIPRYESSLSMRDYAHHSFPVPPPSAPPYSYTNPRRELFTHKETNGVNVPKGTYTARLDAFLIPTAMLNRPGILYDARDRHAFSDHKELWMHIPASAEPPARVQRRFVLAHDDCSNAKLQPIFDAILDKYEAFGLFDKPPSTTHFTFYTDLLNEVTAAARTFNKHRQRDLLDEIGELYRRRARLANEQRGAGRIIHKDVLADLEERAAAMADTLATNVRAKAAAVWIRHGDNGSRWQAIAAKQALAPRRTQYIERLRAHLPGEDSATAPVVTGSTDLGRTAHAYYSE
ncbi:hypothetical protein GGI02_004849, partial [Coemansia sp. RSA 2322]